MTGVGVAGVGILTPWGEGTVALPSDAATAADGARVLALPRPPLEGERFRRATRECLLGIAAVEALLRDATLGRDGVRGERVALVYVTAGAYGASNRAFIESAGGGQTLHFPYTAPSAVPAEVTIEFGITGPYLTLLGGAPATLEALWQAGELLRRGAADRALVLAVETAAECADLHQRARWHAPRLLVEAAVCALLVPGPGRLAATVPRAPAALEQLTRRKAGETLACAPLIALGLARDSGASRFTITGEWRGRRAGLEWEAGAGRRSA